MIRFRTIRRSLRFLPAGIAALLLAGCVVVPPRHHHHPDYRPVYAEPAPRHCRC